MSGVSQAVFMNQRSFGPPPGQQAYTTAGTYSWVAPAGVTSVSVVAVGRGGYRGSNCYACGFFGGGGGGGGALAYKNNITVVPSNSYTVFVGNSSFSCFGCGTVKAAKGVDASFRIGGAGGAAACSIGDVKYSGGKGGDGLLTGSPCSSRSGAGGGAAGYSGNGGAGANGAASGNTGSSAAACSGGGGGGGSATSNVTFSGGGGGVGILGKGITGSGGTPTNRGGGGSGGFGGGNCPNGGNYGGGGGGKSFCQGVCGGTAGGGAVRIIWPGTTRQFPSTNTGNL